MRGLYYRAARGCLTVVYYNWPVIELNIPGRGTLRLEHLVCDVNGTLALDGDLPDGLARALAGLRDRLTVHLLTADTHGRKQFLERQLHLAVVTVGPGEEAAQRAAYVQGLGAERVVAIGQGANDAAMLKAAGLGVCVLSAEGVSLEALNAADLLVPDIFAALDLLERPLRIVASLRR